MNEFVEQLANSPIYYFRDWKSNNIPSVCAGVYTIYDQHETLIYVGMAGAELTQARIDDTVTKRKKSGLRDRLGSHASGYRSGDRFNIYIGDIYVLQQLTQTDIAAISQRKLSFDSLIKNYIQKNLSYRYLVTQNTIVRALENYIQIFGINGALPTINKRADSSIATA